MVGEPTELSLVEQPAGDEMSAYERLLGDAVAGDATLFARQDAVEAAWRVVDPVLGDVTPAEVYERGTWGPADALRLTAAIGGWAGPTRAQRLTLTSFHSPVDLVTSATMAPVGSGRSCVAAPAPLRSASGATSTQRRASLPGVRRSGSRPGGCAVGSRAGSAGITRATGSAFASVIGSPWCVTWSGPVPCMSR
jgi:hypothetical protein